MITEYAKLNLKDGTSSEFPADDYRVWVQKENISNIRVYMYIQSFRDNWTIKVFIENGALCEVENYRTRGSKDRFSDIIMKVQTWFRKSTLKLGRIGTNQDAATNKREACNSSQRIY